MTADCRTAISKHVFAKFLNVLIMHSCYCTSEGPLLSHLQWATGLGHNLRINIRHFELDRSECSSVTELPQMEAYQNKKLGTLLLASKMKELTVRQKMLATWGAIKKSLSCESNASEVYDPDVSRRSSCIRKCRSGYSSKSIPCRKGVVDGSKRHRVKLTSQSPLSIRSSELANPITHQLRFSNATCELKIARGNVGISPDLFSRNSSGSSFTRFQPVVSLGSRVTSCEKCGENLKKWEDAEAHHFSMHAVTELVEGDPSRNVIERIVQTGPSRFDNWMRSARILKVHNLQTTLAQFEEYREMVKIRAHNLSNKHPRCLADGNELLRFYGTTFTCSLDENNSATLCRSNRCNVCCILRRGFTLKKTDGHLLSVFTSSTAEEAYKYTHLDEGNRHLSKALIICRVIAGRVQKPLDRFFDKAVESGFDSVAGKLGHGYNIEKLYSLDSSALLPCFIIVCEP